jgi:hypothetical protein
MLHDMFNRISRKVLAPMATAFALVIVTATSTLTADITYAFNSAPINHWQEGRYRFDCPNGYVVGDTTNPFGIPFTNVSSSGVSATLNGGGYGQRSVWVSFFNWNWWGYQRASIVLACHTDPLVQNPGY